MSDTDLELLARYSRQQAEDAFAELVRRHVDLVYSAALRQVRSPQLAEEVAQSTFIKLSRLAPQLAPDTILTAWLYQVARHEAIDVVRREARRQLREQIALEMNTMNSTAAGWKDIEPFLEEAMHTLDETDRAAVLLRYFENKSLREVGAALGTSDDAAQKRVSRAVEHLREFFARRGVTVGASGLVIVISANAIQAAPAGLAITISTVAGLAGTTIATKAIAMTTVQKTIITTTLAVAVGTGVYETSHAFRLREQNQALQQQQAPLAEQIQQLQRERDEATRQLAALREDNERLSSTTAELLKLRGEVGSLRRALTEASRKAAGNQSPSSPRNRDDGVPPERTPTASTTDLNPVTRMDAPFEISQLRDVGNDSIEAAAQTVLWSVFNRDEKRFDRIRYRDPDAPQMTAKDLQQRLDGLAGRFAGATDVTIAYWSKEGENRRLVHFLAPCPDNNQSVSIPEGGTLVFQRTETGWNLDQFVVQSRGISKTTN